MDRHHRTGATKASKKDHLHPTRWAVQPILKTYCNIILVKIYFKGRNWIIHFLFQPFCSRSHRKSIENVFLFRHYGWYVANRGGDAGKRNQNLHLHDGHSYDIDHHDHYSGYIHDVKHGLAIKFLFDKDHNVGYWSATKIFWLCWSQYIIITSKYFKMVHFSGIIGANYTTRIMPSTVRLQVHSLHQSTIKVSFHLMKYKKFSYLFFYYPFHCNTNWTGGSILDIFAFLE